MGFRLPKRLTFPRTRTWRLSWRGCSTWNPSSVPSCARAVNGSGWPPRPASPARAAPPHPAGPAGPPQAGPAGGGRAGSPVRRIDTGAVTERVVSEAAQAGERLVLGRAAVLTPLARDRAGAAGVEIEKER